MELFATDIKRPEYITNYIGSKQKLVDWIWKHTPEGVESVLDAFCGSAVVAYMYKTKGLRVIANDRLHYCHHAARAIVENGNVRISQEELEALLADNPKAGTFVRDSFKGLFFADGVHKVIDAIRANIDALSGFKKDIALFALERGPRQQLRGMDGTHRTYGVVAPGWLWRVFPVCARPDSFPCAILSI